MYMFLCSKYWPIYGQFLWYFSNIFHNRILVLCKDTKKHTVYLSHGRYILPFKLQTIIQGLSSPVSKIFWSLQRINCLFIERTNIKSFLNIINPKIKSEPYAIAHTCHLQSTSERWVSNYFFWNMNHTMKVDGIHVWN